MSVPAQRALRTAIDQRIFDRVYYLHGDDDYRKDEAVRRIIGAAVDPAMRDFNLDVFRGTEVDGERLAGALAALPMMAERRVVVLRDIGSLRKAARGALERYLEAPSKEIVLVVTSLAGDKPDAAIAGCSTSVAFPMLTAEQLAGWLVKHAREELGVELTEESAVLVADAVAGDLAHGAGELDKLASFVRGGPISAADVEAIVGVRRGETMVDLLDAVAARDARRALPLVGAVLAQPKSSAVWLVSMLSLQTLAMAWGRASVEAGTAMSRLTPEFMGLLKSGGGHPGRPWGDAVKCWSGNLPRWSSADLALALERLLAADVALKDTRVSSEEAILESLVLSLCTMHPRTAAA